MTDRKELLASLDDLPSLPKPRAAPVVEFHHYPNHARKWVAVIRMPNDVLHCGEGMTQCEALMLANVHWAMHGVK